MSDTGQWAQPNPIYNYCTGGYETGGVVWMGDEFPSSNDFKILYDNWGQGVDIDVPTLFGGEDYYHRKHGGDCYTQHLVVS